MTDEPLLPVAVYLPVALHRRKGVTVQWWTCQLAKRPDFDLADFTPFKLVTTYTEPWGEYQKVWPLRVQSLDPERRLVFCEPESFAASKVAPFERCLFGCGWEMCGAPEEALQPATE